MLLSSNLIDKQVPIAPLTSFRVLFGFMMVVSIVRFASYGWIHDLYVDPQFYFTFYGFDWVRPLGEAGTYCMYGVMLLSAVGIMIGLFYRISAIAFFLSFTYIELIDKTNYLNHYYFVSLVAFLLILLPANRGFSLDVRRGAVTKLKFVPAWTINVIKLQLVMVYFFAGIAKLNYYWLVEAMPLKLWLPAKSHIPIIGKLLQYEWVAYLFCWAGALYDLTISFLLMIKKTRGVAFFSVVVFHVLTAVLFQIGMFPFIMIVSTMIFFSAERHLKWQSWLSNLFSNGNDITKGNLVHVSSAWSNKRVVSGVLVAFFVIQLLLPFRYLTYPGQLFWTEQGYRFSWRVMLIEKAGFTTFRVEDDGGKKEWIQNYDHLTPQQEKMMSTQPDMILQFAHYLRDEYSKKGFENPRVYCDSKVTLNGRRSQQMVDPKVNLSIQKRGFRNIKWIKDFERDR